MPRLPTEESRRVLDRIHQLAEVYTGPGRYSQIGRATNKNPRTVRAILLGQKRRVVIHNLTLVKGSDPPKLCRKCGNPILVLAVPFRVCVQCQLAKLIKQGLLEVLDQEPEG